MACAQPHIYYTRTGLCACLGHVIWSPTVFCGSALVAGSYSSWNPVMGIILSSVLQMEQLRLRGEDAMWANATVRVSADRWGETSPIVGPLSRAWEGRGRHSFWVARRWDVPQAPHPSPTATKALHPPGGWLERERGPASGGGDEPAAARYIKHHAPSGGRPAPHHRGSIRAGGS